MKIHLLALLVLGLGAFLRAESSDNDVDAVADADNEDELVEAISKRLVDLEDEADDDGAVELQKRWPRIPRIRIPRFRIPRIRIPRIRIPRIRIPRIPRVRIPRIRIPRRRWWGKRGLDARENREE